MINLINKLRDAFDRFRRTVAVRAVASVESVPASEPKKPRGRPRLNRTIEEQRAASAKRQADHRERLRQKEAEAARKKALERNVGQLDEWQDSEGHPHCGIVQEIDADGRAVTYREIAVDANGTPRKYRNGQWMWLENVTADEPQWPAWPNPPADTPTDAPPAESVQPAPVIPPPPPKPAPEPVDNADSLRAFWASHGRMDFTPDITQFFLVSSAANVEAASRMGQLAVATPRWHSDYDEKFSPVTKLWVVVTRSDGEWLKSLLGALPAIREKMRLCVCDDIQVLLGLKAATDYAIFRGQHVSVEGFYESHFRPMPQDAGQVDKLLRPPQPQPTRTVWEPDWRMGGSAGSGGNSGVEIEVPSPGSNPNGSNHGNDGSGCCM